MSKVMPLQLRDSHSPIQTLIFVIIAAETWLKMGKSSQAQDRTIVKSQSEDKWFSVKSMDTFEPVRVHKYNQGTQRRAKKMVLRSPLI